MLVAVKRLKERMILLEDVKDIKERLLLTKGQEVSTKHIKILKMWGITEVNIVGGAEEDKSSPDINPELNEEIIESTKYIFKHTDITHPAIKELFHLSVLHRSKNKIIESNEIRFPNTIIDNEINYTDVRKNIFEKKIKLPEIPSIIFELNEVIANPLTSSDNIAQVVTRSPSLAAILLKIVNSPFYYFPSEIDSISRAVTIIGTREISSLALGISIISIFKDIPKEIIDMNSILRHCLACGIISRIIAAHKDMRQTEQLFVSGLLHDIGRLVIYQYFPEEAKNLLSHAIESEKLLYGEENIYLGCRHTDIGRFLLQSWKLPFALENNVFYHHNPSSAKEPVPASVVHLADIMANGLGIGSSGERFVPTLDEKAWKCLDLSPNSFEGIIKQATHQISSLESFLQQ